MATNPNTPSPSSPGPPAIRDVSVLVEWGLAPNKPAAHRLVREKVLPAGVTVRIGRRVYIDTRQLGAFCAAGGQALPGGWRRDRGGAGHGSR